MRAKTDGRYSHPGVADLPLRQIVENAGVDAAVVLNAVKAGKGAYGYNAGTGEYDDMLEEGTLAQSLCHASRAAECSVGCGSAAHDGSHDRGSAERRRPCSRRRCGGWHGRDGYVSSGNAR